VVSGVLAVLVLAASSGTAWAADDPGPVQWPKIDPPQSEGDRFDPSPQKWIRIDPPSNDGSRDDPEPNDWPAPAQT
jgi:hypothetical protein